MTTAIDTNIIVALWHDELSVSTAVQSALETAFRRGSLMIAAPVFAELIAAPGRTEDFVNTFLAENRIAVDWSLDEAIWRAAGRAFQTHAARRRSQGEPGPRRLLADFLIGAHAQMHGYRLLTLDERHYRAAFPGLKLELI
jgi:predicted nucleic acid-binding protein